MSKLDKWRTNTEVACLKNIHLHQINGEKRLRYDTRNTRTGLKISGSKFKICGSNQYVPSEMFYRCLQQSISVMALRSLELYKLCFCLLYCISMFAHFSKSLYTVLLFLAKCKELRGGLRLLHNTLCDRKTHFPSK